MAAASSVAACCKAILAILASEIHPRGGFLGAEEEAPTFRSLGGRAGALVVIFYLNEDINLHATSTPFPHSSIPAGDLIHHVLGDPARAFAGWALVLIVGMALLQPVRERTMTVLPCDGRDFVEVGAGLVEAHRPPPLNEFAFAHRSGVLEHSLAQLEVFEEPQGFFVSPLPLCSTPHVLTKAPGSVRTATCIRRTKRGPPTPPRPLRRPFPRRTHPRGRPVPQHARQQAHFGWIPVA